jgi:hypothetical protein
MDSPSYFLEKAAQCRRLAASITVRKDPAIEALLALAAEFDGKAIAAQAEAKADAEAKIGGISPAASDDDQNAHNRIDPDQGGP